MIWVLNNINIERSVILIAALLNIQSVLVSYGLLIGKYRGLECLYRKKIQNIWIFKFNTILSRPFKHYTNNSDC